MARICAYPIVNEKNTQEGRGIGLLGPIVRNTRGQRRDRDPDWPGKADSAQPVAENLPLPGPERRNRLRARSVLWAASVAFDEA